MQDIHSIAGGRMFGGGGGAGAGDRRLRPYQLHGGHHQQALKCPRCDSLNTKFCYYNNYNLSQPRHFCKNCRRYWTKGGVLRNVPVGGGCRKTKRSKPKHSAVAEPAAEAGPATSGAEATTGAAAQAGDRNTSSRSSSESSSLTATTTAAAEAVSATSSVSPSSFFNIHDYKSIIAQSMNAPPPSPSSHVFDQGLLEQSSGCGMFSEIGNFSNLITSAAEPLPFGFGGVLDQNNHWSSQQNDHQDDHKIHQQGGGEIPSSNDGAPAGPFLDQTIQVDLLPGLPGRPSGKANEAFGPLDWQPGADQGLFDLPGGLDPAYWGQNPQWADEDHQHGLYLP